MNSLRNAFIAVALMGLLVVIGVILNQRAQIRDLREALAAAEADRLPGTPIDRPVVNAPLPSLDPVTGAPIEPSSVEEAKRWLASLERIRDRLLESPPDWIPEMSFMDNGDWLVVVRSADVSTERGMRAAMASLRTAGKQRFVPMAQKALADFAKARDGQLPATTAELSPYFEAKLPENLLGRYRMLRSGKASPVDATPPVYDVEESASPRDPEHDLLSRFNAGQSTFAGAGAR